MFVNDNDGEDEKDAISNLSNFLRGVFFKTLASLKNSKYPIILETLIYVSILFSPLKKGPC